MNIIHVPFIREGHMYKQRFDIPIDVVREAGWDETAVYYFKSRKNVDGQIRLVLSQSKECGDLPHKPYFAKKTGQTEYGINIYPFIPGGYKVADDVQVKIDGLNKEIHAVFNIIPLYR